MSHNRPITLLILLATTSICGEALAQSGEKKVCVQVTLKEGGDEQLQVRTSSPVPAAATARPAEAPALPPAVTPEGGVAPVQLQAPVRAQAQLQPQAPAPAAASATRPARQPSPRITPFLPIGQNPVSYLRRLIEHYVTHEAGFVAVNEGCDERVIVELYPLDEGWTAFARYSGTGREERVDQLFPAELSPFAERAVLALLHDRPISATINRENVLRADSLRSTQQVHGTNHWVLGLGTALRGGLVDTAQDDGSADEEVRLFNTMSLGLGYRGKFEGWGVEAGGQLGLGTSKTAARRNPEGGHIDFGGSLGGSLHVLRYFDPRGVSSFYTGAGSTFELLWFDAVSEDTSDSEYDYYTDDDRRSTLYSGGLTVDLVGGYEFMRASRVHFLMQGELNLPAYLIQSENEDGSIHTWLPGVTLKLGMVF